MTQLCHTLRSGSDGELWARICRPAHMLVGTLAHACTAQGCMRKIQIGNTNFVQQAAWKLSADLETCQIVIKPATYTFTKGPAVTA